MNFLPQNSLKSFVKIMILLFVVGFQICEKCIWNPSKMEVKISWETKFALITCWWSMFI